MAAGHHEHSVVLHLEGEFDVPAARLLEHSLRGVGAADRIRIDFSAVRRFNDYGIAALASALTKLDGRRVKLEGLRMHQVRLLRYFGLDADVFRGSSERDRGGDST